MTVTLMRVSTATMAPVKRARFRVRRRRRAASAAARRSALVGPVRSRCGLVPVLVAPPPLAAAAGPLPVEDEDEALAGPEALAVAFGWPGGLAAGRGPEGGRGRFRFFLLAMNGEVTAGLPTIAVVLQAGDKAPSFTLPAVDGGEPVTDPWTEGPTVLSFFKVSCPVCKMVAPMLTKLAEGGVRVVGVGQDPPAAITKFNETENQRVPAVSEPDPFEVSESFGLEAVPSIFLINPDGQIDVAIAGWSRDLWNDMAAKAGMEEPLSTPDDGLRPFRPG